MSNKLLFLVALALSLYVENSGAFKVLGILPFGSKSHHAIGSSILKSLTEVGHEVTVLSAFPLKTKEKNYHDIKVTKILEVFERGDEVNPFIFGKYPAIGTIVVLSKMNADIVDLFMSDTEIQKFMKTDQKFDVCLIEIFNVDALLGIPEKFNCILMSFTTFATVKWSDDITGNISPTSYVPNPFYLYSATMTFAERFWNTAFSLAEHMIFHGYHLPKQRALYKKHFPNAKRTFEEMYRNSSIIFMNTHVSSSTVRPQLPQTVEIAGIHIQKVKALPDDIQTFLDSAKDGVILFSMGSFIQSKMWPVDKREAFVKAFGKLKQRVLWKYENETLPNNPGNIKISAWIPQRDILAHPNVKIFITHGGILGTSEGVVEGKPILGIPIFGDQRMNMAKAVSKGYGLQVNFDEVTEESVFEALNKLLNDPSYSEMAKKVSSQFLDRPMSPQESVVYWTEYAVNHRGAPHLQAAATRLNFIELHSIDVYSLLAAIFVVILIIDYYILKAIIKRCFKKKTQPKLKKQ